MIRLVAKTVAWIVGLSFPASMAYGAYDYIAGGGCETALCCESCPVVSVTRIIDGDTFVSGQRRVRLYGMDTPERGERCFTEATDRLRELAGSGVRVEEGDRLRDPYGKYLFYTYTRAGESIDEMLLREGLAVPWTRDGQHRDLLIAVATAARSSSTGCLW